MKFRTEIEIAPFADKFGYDNRILALGSCFADNMSKILKDAKFRVVSNPTGVLFNPASIAQTLHRFESGRKAATGELRESGGRWFDYDFHGTLAAETPEKALANIDAAIAAGHNALQECDRMIITFGTAWVYVLNETGKVVANCHKQPANGFTRRRMTVEEIVGLFAPLLDGMLAKKKIIFTVSPVRHLGDGADENFLSKATLKVAVAELVRRFANAYYFPAYEILNDDLRDYRFYADDLVHPSSRAIAYIREKFFDAALSEQAKRLLPRVEKIAAAAAHRPQNPADEAYREFCRRQIEEIQTVEGVDLSAELAYFASILQ
ncbi:MAG: GSCFA domain-containing protein [Alistipes sp.]|nr:GSCFA domain-containing protein [Alistipes sp.]